MLTKIALVFLIGFLSGCTSRKGEVVVYCTVDQVFSEPILKDFEKETGINVKAVFDTEEAKSTGVMNRLIAEKDNPQCDVFWSGDPVRNGVLRSKDITQSFNSENESKIPEYFKAKDKHWIGFSARARVLFYNTKRIAKDSLPTSILELPDERFKGKFAIANPLFGTTTFHIASLFTVLGDEKAKEWMSSLKDNGVVIATSNGDVRKQVVNGEIAFGLTDTDDAFEGKKESADVDYIFLDQEPGQLGTLIMPNALSAIKGSANTENGKRLINYLLSKETEAKLARSCAQMPLLSGTEVPSGTPSLDAIIPMKIDYDATAQKLEEIQPWIKQWLEN